MIKPEAKIEPMKITLKLIKSELYQNLGQATYLVGKLMERVNISSILLTSNGCRLQLYINKLRQIHAVQLGLLTI